MTQINRAPIFDEVRAMLGRGFTQAEVRRLDRAFDRALGIVKPRAVSNGEAFYKALRKIMGPLDQTQVDSINSLLSAAAHWPVGWLAYALATAFHESRLRPIKEMGSDQYLSKYDTGRLAKVLGNTPQADGDGIRYAGRGFVQITGRTNYRNAGKHLGIDLLADPDKALDPGIATRILVWGMETGAFTGKSLSDYVSQRGTHSEFVNARRIINGTDRASLIAGYAVKFQDALEAGGWR